MSNPSKPGSAAPAIGTTDPDGVPTRASMDEQVPKAPATAGEDTNSDAETDVTDAPGPTWPAPGREVTGRTDGTTDTRYDGLPCTVGAYRLDRGKITSHVKTPEGFLKVDAHATRTGIFTYMDKAGKVQRELRLPDHVFHPDSMASLAEKPVTNTHPSVGLLDSRTAAGYAKGWTGPQIVQDGQFLGASTTIIDEGLIKEIEQGHKREVSCGYTCDLVQQSGQWNGENYDAIQTNIRYNHLAVVPKGRAGSEVRLRLDASEQIDPTNSQEERTIMTKIRIDGVEYEVSEAVATAYAGQVRRDAEEMDKVKKDKEQVEKDLQKEKEDKAAIKTASVTLADAKTKAEAKADALQSQLDVRLDGADFIARVNERVALIESAKSVLGTVKNDASDVDIKKDVIAKILPAVNLDGKDDVYVNASYDAAMATVRKDSNSSGRLHEKVADAQRSDAGTVSKVQSAHEKLRQDSQDGWRQPIGKVKV